MVALRLAYVAPPPPTFLRFRFPAGRWLRRAWAGWWRCAQWSIGELHRIRPGP